MSSVVDANVGAVEKETVDIDVEVEVEVGADADAVGGGEVSPDAEV
eukprot:CAMPEP_0114055120 /NCGR_PEP_ID=MMETSP1339-20121228/89636_1 /TAXON_ID=94617 /ORGANISM="Fibrocapsa japonica" /LENGTH=45 /assembly_acc=CAM_ASM_000762